MDGWCAGWRGLVGALVVGVVLAGCAFVEADPGPDGSGVGSDGQVQASLPALHPDVDALEAGVVEVVDGDGQSHEVAVRIADTSEARAQGLMYVEELPDGVGMWFVFEEDTDGAFWMNDTLVALDIVYVNADDQVVSVVTAPPCDVPEDTRCPSYPPEDEYRHVLEVPGGWMEQVGAGPGDTVRLVPD